MTRTSLARRTPTWLRALTLIVLLAVVVVGVARYCWRIPDVAAFVKRYPGVSPGASLRGTPLWTATLHALNLFLMIQIIQSGVRIRTAKHPIGHWKPRHQTKSCTITIEQWFHVSLDLIWLVCGALYIVLLFLTGRWRRIIPTSPDVVPNAVSVAIQYASIHLPSDDTWVAYNSLQMLSYFTVIFILAPLSAVTGLRMSLLWPTALPINRHFTIEFARAVHFPVMILFCAFIVIHVTMIACSGPLRTVNHMFGGSDKDSLTGVLVLAGVLAVAAILAALSRPLVVRSLAALTGKVTR